MIISPMFREVLFDISSKSLVAVALLSPLCATTQYVNQLDFDHDRQRITFLPSNRDAGRQSARPARVARKALASFVLETLTDYDFEIFTNQLKAYQLSRYGTIEIVTGKDIRYWYTRVEPAPRSGTLINSCMRYDECNLYMNVYAKNPKSVALAVSRDGLDRLKARALVWTDQNGNKLLDRVYGSDAMMEFFRREATNLKMFTRDDNHTNEMGHGFLTPEGKRGIMVHRVDLNDHRCQKYPYLDTMFYYNRKEGFLTHDPRPWPGVYHLLRSADGRLTIPRVYD